jgi:hypothetical protein
MPDQPSQRRALRLLEQEITHLEREIQRQRNAIAALPGAFWQAYVAHAWLTAAKLQLVLLYAQCRRLRAEPWG